MKIKILVFNLLFLLSLGLVQSNNAMLDSKDKDKLNKEDNKTVTVTTISLRDLDDSLAKHEDSFAKHEDSSVKKEGITPIGIKKYNDKVGQKHLDIIRNFIIYAKSIFCCNCSNSTSKNVKASININLIDLLEAFVKLKEKIDEDIKNQTELEPQGKLINYRNNLIKALRSIDFVTETSNLKKKNDINDRVRYKISELINASTQKEGNKDKNLYSSLFNRLSLCITKLLNSNIKEEEKRKLFNVFRYFLGKNIIIDNNSFFRFFTKDLRKEEVALALLQAIAFNDIDEMQDSTILDANLAFTQLLPCVKTKEKIQDLFDSIAKNLDCYNYIHSDTKNETTTPFVKKNDQNIHLLQCLTKIILYCDKTTIALDKTLIEDKVFFNFDHIIALPNDTFSLTGLHIWPAGKAKIKRVVNTSSFISRKQRDVTAKVSTELNQDILHAAVSPKYSSEIVIGQLKNKKCQILKFDGNECKKDETPNSSLDDLIVNINNDEKTSSFFPSEFIKEGGYDLLLQCLHTVYLNHKAVKSNGENKQIIGSFKYKADSGCKKIYVILFFKGRNKSNIIPVISTAYPLAAFKEFPRIKNSKKEFPLVNAEDNKRASEIKKLILSDIRDQLSSTNNLKSHLRQIKPVNNRELIATIFNFTWKEIGWIEDEAQQTIISELLKTEESRKKIVKQTHSIVPKLYSFLINKYSSKWSAKKIGRTALFIVENLQIKSDPLISYFIHEKIGKSDIILTAECTCRTITTDRLSDKFDPQYKYIKTLGECAFFLHIKEQEILNALQ